MRREKKQKLRGLQYWKPVLGAEEKTLNCTSKLAIILFAKDLSW
jgi:hypothetical protein